MSVRKLVYGLFTAIMLMALMPGAAPVAAEMCGDLNHDGSQNILDISLLIQYKYHHGFTPVPIEIADVDGSGAVNILDIVHYINFKYKDGAGLECPLWSHRETQSNCLSFTAKSDYDTEAFSSGCLDNPCGEETMSVAMIEGDLHVYHDNAYYQCCLGYLAEFTVDGQNITVVESDTGDFCDCYCCFDLEAVLYGLIPIDMHDYYVTLIGIEGDTIGVDTVFCEDFSYVRFEVDGDDLHIRHINAFYNCGLNYVVDYVMDGFNITATESDTGQPADCICFFDLESVLYDLDPGVYQVSLIGIYGFELATGSVLIGGAPQLLGYTQSDCIESPLKDDIDYTYDDGILLMEHHDAYFNCGAEVDDGIVIYFAMDGDKLIFREINETDMWAYCMCYYELSAEVNNIPPGTYTAEIWARDYPTEPITLIDRRELILE